MPYGTVNADLMTTSDGVSSSGLYGFKNRIINGAMLFVQRGTSFTNPSSGTYTLDRWQYRSTSATPTQTIAQNGGSVTPPTGFSNYLSYTASNAFTPSSTDRTVIGQYIEGFNTYDFAWGTANAKAASFSFWAYSSLTGSFGGAIKNSNEDYAYPFSYTISSANTWTYVTILITAPTSGTWTGATNTTSVEVYFALGSGSTRQGTANTWQSGDLWAATGSVNVTATSGAYLYVTGVQFEKGSTATSFDYRPYGTEESLCQRYYYRVKANSGGNGLFGVGWCRSTTEATVSIPYPTAMRTNPTALEQSGTAANYQLVFAASAAALSAVPVFGGETTTQGTRIDCTVASGLTAGHGVGLRAGSTSAYLAWSAEL
jgi:hypothetical protein